MDDNRFDDVIQNLPRDFNAPPAPPLDEMWSVIEDAHFNAPASQPRTRGVMASAPWLAAAATLLIGIGIGRYLPLPGIRSSSGSDAIASSAAGSTSTAGASLTADTSALADAYRDQTNHYLGQAAALLIALPTKNGSGAADAAFATKAGDLLVTTRLLIDSPAANQDPKLHSLLEDLELVLVQIARLHGDRSKGDLDLIHQAVEQGDVISRLNSAVVTTQSSE
jgi:hypothetical protein